MGFQLPDYLFLVIVMQENLWSKCVSSSEDKDGDDNALDGAISSSNRQIVALDRQETVLFRWTYDEDNIICQLTAPTQGWIGIGVSPGGTMVNADLIIMGVDDGRVYVYDSFSFRNAAPTMDASQDAEVLYSKENATHTTVAVRRPRISPDGDDISIQEGPQQVIWAYGNRDLFGTPISSDYHARRGSKEIVLIPESKKEVKQGEGEDVLETTVTPQVATTPSQNNPDTRVEVTDGDSTFNPAEGPTPDPASFPGGEDTTPVLEFTTTRPRTNPKEPGVESGSVLLTDGFQLSWSANPEHIQFRISAPTKGWVGIGFSPDGTMAGADLIIAGLGDKGPYVYDAHAEDNDVPDVDDSQDVTMTLVRENATHTILAFRRKLITSDAYDMDITGGEMNIIWAFGTDDLEDVPTSSGYHSSDRGSKIVTLIPAKKSEGPVAVTTTTEPLVHDETTPYPKGDVDYPDYSETTPSPEKENEEPRRPASGQAFLGPNILLKWTERADYMIFQISIPTIGWFGIGFSPDGSMSGADFIIAGSRNLEKYVYDTHTDSNGIPQLDDSQDVVIMGAFENGTHATLIFRRKIETLDQDDMDIKPGKMNIVWAYGSEDLLEAPTKANYEVRNQGLKVVELIPGGDDADSGKVTVSTTAAAFNEYDYPDEETTASPKVEREKTITPPPPAQQAFLGSDIVFKWAQRQDAILFEISVPTSGWFGIGLSPDGSMSGADLIIAGLRDGEKYVYDTHTDSNGIPRTDESQDVLNLVSYDNGTHSKLILRRNLVTHDEDDMEIKPGKMHVVWAFGEEDLFEAPTKANYNVMKQGSKELELIPGRDESNTGKVTVATTTPSFPIQEEVTPTLGIDYFDEEATALPRVEKEEPEQAPPTFGKTSLGSNIMLTWNARTGYITFQLSVPTTGWFGIGFSSDGSMDEADFIIAGVKGQEKYVYDTHINSDGIPEMDDSQDVTIMTAFENDTHAALIVRRKLDTLDIDDMEIRPGKMHIVWAYGEKDLSEAPTKTNYNAIKEGSKIIQLLPGGDEGDIGNVATTTPTPETTTEFRVEQEETTLFYFPEETTAITEEVDKAVENEGEKEERRTSGDVYLSQGFRLSWRLLGDRIAFQIIAPTLGWVGLGFSSDGSMVGADLIMGGVREKEKYIYDTHSDRNGVPQVDESQDLTLLDASENGTHTTIALTRNLKTSDDDDVNIEGGIMHIIWAYGKNDVIGEPSRKDYHFGSRGSKEIQLLPAIDGLSGGRSVTVSMRTPAGETTTSAKMDEKEGTTAPYVFPDITTPFPDLPDVTTSVPETPKGGRPSPRLGKEYLSENIELKWSKIGNEIIFQISAPTSGWIGLGFSSDGSMAGADFMIGGIRKGENYVYDMHIDQRGDLQIDASQDVDLLAAFENATHTTIVLRKKLDISDEDDMDLESGILNVIWAYGKDDLSVNPSEEEYQFVDQGSKPIEIFTKEEGNKIETTTLFDGFEIETTIDPFIVSETTAYPDSDGDVEQPDATQSIFAERNLKIKWSRDSEGGVIVQMVAPTQGWVGFGFSKDGSMVGADLIIAGVTDDYNDYIYDTHTDEEGIPKLDEFQDVKLLVSYANETHTTIVLNRNLSTDDTDDMDIKEGSIYILWAYGEEDIEDPSKLREFKYISAGSNLVEMIPKADELEETTESPEPEVTTALFHQNKGLLGKPDSVFLNLEETVQLQWSIDESKIIFQVVAPTLGWVGLGFSPDGTMAGADMAIAGVRDGREYIFDTHSDRNGLPYVDDSQDIELMDAYENGTHTTIVLRRNLEASDEDDLAIKEGEMNVIWAYGSFDVLESLGMMNYHRGQRGSKIVELVPRYQDDTTESPQIEETTAYEMEGEPTEPGSEWLDAEQTVRLRWSFADDSILFQFAAPTLGWIGVGFSAKGLLAGSDFIIAGANDDGGYIHDSHGDEDGNLQKDNSQDVDLIVAYENGTYTTAVMRRKLDANEPFDRTIREGKMYIVWAYGKKDLFDDDQLENYEIESEGSKMFALIPANHAGSTTPGNENENTLETTTPPFVLDTTVVPWEASTMVEMIDYNAGQYSTVATDEDVVDVENEETTTPPERETTRTSYPQQKPGTTFLDLQQTVFMKWTYGENSIIFQLTAPTLGWVGIGISQDGTTKNSNFIIAGVDEDYNTYIYDMHTREGKLHLDEIQDTQLMVSFENETHTTAVIRMILKAHDEEDASIKGGQTLIVWAYGSTDVKTTPTTSDYESSMSGSKIVELIPSTYETSRNIETEGGHEVVKSTKAASLDPTTIPVTEEKITRPVQTPLPPSTGEQRHRSYSEKPTTRSPSSPNFTGMIALDEEKTVILRWASDQQNIILQMTAPTLGWIGIGFATHDPVEKSDMIIMGVDKNQGYVLDAYTLDATRKLDASQDVKLLSFRQNTTHTSVMVQRQLKTEDNDDISITEGEINIIWEYGLTDMRNIPGDIIHSGSKRGTKVVKLISETQSSTRDMKAVILLSAAITLLILIMAKMKN